MANQKQLTLTLKGLEFMLENIHLLQTGLCKLNISLSGKFMFRHEVPFLDKAAEYMDNNPPSDTTKGEGLYWYTRGVIPPRRKWLEESITLLKGELEHLERKDELDQASSESNEHLEQ